MTGCHGGLPRLLRELAEEMGGATGGALALVREFGGTRIYVPGDPRPDQNIPRRCGMEVARALARIRGGEEVDVPNLARERTMNRILNTPGSAKTVARRHGCTERWVREVRSRERSQAGLPLFPDEPAES